MANEMENALAGELLGEDRGVTLAEVCRICGVNADEVIELVEEGVVEPEREGRTQWRFHSVSVWRVRRAVQFRQDLGVNNAGAALALDLLEELQQLRARVRQLEE